MAATSGHIMDKQYPIAEIFESIQGEGTWIGTPMTFIRLAGCCIGKPYTEDARRALGLAVFQERCTDWQGNSFPCDTNYRRARMMTVSQVVELPEVHRATRICITGGEPFMHDIRALVARLRQLFKACHIETSGAVEVGLDLFAPSRPWITVSPKQGCLDSSILAASEIKVVVGDGFDENKFLLELDRWRKLRRLPTVFLSPVNNCDHWNNDNMRRCVELVQKHRTLGLRLTVQLHKAIGLR